LASAERSAQVLYLWLRRHVTEVHIVGTSPGAPSELRLRPDELHAVGFEDDEALLPWSETGFTGFRLLQEYNVLPAKFAFVDVDGFQRVASLGAQPQGVDVIFVFDAPLKQLRDVGPADVKLHCVPVVNVFQSTAEPVRVDPGREQHLVRVAGLAPQHGEVYAITKVRGISRSSAQRSELAPFFGFDHVAQANTGKGAFYNVHLRPSVVSEGADTYVSIGTAEDSGTLADFETLSLDVLATNGPLANAVRAGEIRVATPSSPSYAQFKNLVAVTPHVPPPLGLELQWRATAHVAMNLRSLTEPQVLRSVLGIYNLRAITDRQAARANELRMQAIRDVQVRPAERLFRGALIRGVQVETTLDESGFLGEGDAFLFGNVLERLFADYVSLNSFSQTRVSLMPSQTVWSWAPRNGAQTLL
jgi:type VI secretion system protein ImpG